MSQPIKVVVDVVIHVDIVVVVVMVVLDPRHLALKPGQNQVRNSWCCYCIC